MDTNGLRYRYAMKPFAAGAGFGVTPSARVIFLLLFLVLVLDEEAVSTLVFTGGNGEN